MCLVLVCYSGRYRYICTQVAMVAYDASKEIDHLLWLAHHEESSKMESESAVDSDRDDVTDEQSDIDDIELSKRFR